MPEWAADFANGIVPTTDFVGFLLAENGALKLARLTKSHIGEFVAVIIGGRVRATPKIIGEMTGGRAFIPGNTNEEQARLIAKGIMVK